MKINWKSLWISTGLLLIVVLVVLVGISIFISGPSRKYEMDIKKQEQAIVEKNKNIKDLTRHVFQYTTYNGEDVDAEGNAIYVWFNEKSEIITTIKKDSYRGEEVASKIKSEYGVKETNVHLGYGYTKPAYVVITEKGEYILDYETLDIVYFMEVGNE